MQQQSCLPVQANLPGEASHLHALRYSTPCSPDRLDTDQPATECPLFVLELLCDSHLTGTPQIQLVPRMAIMTAMYTAAASHDWWL